MANQQQRLLELALKGLQLERRQIDEEIADIRRRLSGDGIPASAKPQVAKPAQAKSRLTAAGRRKLSEVMKRRWAVKKRARKQ